MICDICEPSAPLSGRSRAVEFEFRIWSIWNNKTNDFNNAETDVEAEGKAEDQYGKTKPLVLYGKTKICVTVSRAGGGRSVDFELMIGLVRSSNTIGFNK